MAVWKDKFIKPNKYSRPQEKLKAVRKLVLHWTANFGATAEDHYEYFNNLEGRYASAHIFVDKKEALCIIPLNEIAYHANDGKFRGIPELKPNANYLSIGVEMCVEKDGTFHLDTIARTEDVFVELCKRFKLDPLKDIVRHYDITHKNCPAPWVKDGQKFIEFKQRVNAKLKGSAKDSTQKISVQPSKVLIKEGDKGDKIKDLQTKLNQLGYKLAVDGIFGNATETAIKDFQRKNGLVDDGIVGEKTWNKLLEVLKRKQQPTPKIKMPSVKQQPAQTKETPIVRIGEDKVVNNTVGYITYKVKQGDTLIELAKFHNTTVDDIKKLNNLKSDVIYVGQELKLPNKYAPVYHIVQKGETVWEIARKYGVSIEQIKKLNNLKDYTIQPNQKLRVK